MVKLIFPRELRLLTSNAFACVFQHPQRISMLHITILGRLNTLGHPRIGLIVAKKHVKLAYERNRIKRLMRESFRLHQHFLPNMDFVIIAKPGIANLSNQALTDVLEKSWRRYCR